MVLTIELPCRAFFYLGGFTSQSIDSYTIKQFEGIATHYDEDSGYVSWQNMVGEAMPAVHINSVGWSSVKS